MKMEGRMKNSLCRNGIGIALLIATVALLNLSCVLVKKYPPLTDWDLKNGEYLNTDLGYIKLTDGYYDYKAEDYERMIWLFDKIAHGDLNEDGNSDAAIIYISNDKGANGFFYTLAIVLNDKGKPKQVASKFIEDRCPIEKFYILNGTVYVQVLIVHDETRWLIKYSLKNGKLIIKKSNLGKVSFPIR